MCIEQCGHVIGDDMMPSCQRYGPSRSFTAKNNCETSRRFVGISKTNTLNGRCWVEIR